MAPVKVWIKNGPSKHDLMLALFDQNPFNEGYGGNRRRVIFVLEPITDDQKWWVEDQRLELRILQVRMADDYSGDNWDFEGKTRDGAVYQGRYSTGARKGTIEVMPPPKGAWDKRERARAQGLLDKFDRKYVHQM